MAKQNMKSLPSHLAHRATLISATMNISQAPARPQTQGVPVYPQLMLVPNYTAGDRGYVC